MSRHSDDFEKEKPIPDLYPQVPVEPSSLTQAEVDILGDSFEEPSDASTPASKTPIPAAQSVQMRPAAKPLFPKWLGNVLFFGGLTLLSVSLYLKLVEPRNNYLARTADLPLEGRLVEGSAGSVLSIFGDPNDQQYRDMERFNGLKLTQLARQGKIRVVRYQLPIPTGKSALSSRLASRALLCVDSSAPAFSQGVRIAVSRVEEGQIISEEEILNILPDSPRQKVQNCINVDGEKLLAQERETALLVGYVKSPYLALDGVPFVRPVEQLILELSNRN